MAKKSDILEIQITENKVQLKYLQQTLESLTKITQKNFDMLLKRVDNPLFLKEMNRRIGEVEIRIEKEEKLRRKIYEESLKWRREQDIKIAKMSVLYSTGVALITAIVMNFLKL